MRLPRSTLYAGLLLLCVDYTGVRRDGAPLDRGSIDLVVYQSKPRTAVSVLV